MRIVDLARRFCRIVRGRCGGGRVVAGFATSLGQDGAAVRAGLYLSRSGGEAEGRVNCLGPLKRSMYDRAELDLLRHRFLLAARSTELGDEPRRWGPIKALP